MKKIIKFRPYIILLLILIGGAFLRLWGMAHGNFAFTYDVGRDLLAVQKMIEQQKFSLLGPTTGVEGVFYGPWWYLFLAIPFFLTGGNPYVIVSIIAVLGVSVVFMGFLLGREFGGQTLGLLLALFIAFTPPFISFSTQIWSPDLLPPFMIFTLVVSYLLFKGTIKNKFWWLFLGLSATLTFEMEASFGFFFLTATTLMVLIFPFPRKKTINTFFFFWGIILIEGFRMVFELKHNFLQTKSLIKVFQTTTSGEEESFLIKINDTLLLFWQKWIETLGGGNFLISLITLFFTFGIIFFFWKKTAKENRFLAKFLLLIFSLTFAGFIFYPRALWLHYFIGLPLIYLFLFFLALSSFLARSKSLKRRFLICLIFSLAFYASNPTEIYQSIKAPLFKGDAAVFRNQLKVVDAVYNDAGGKRFNYVAYTPPIHPYTWQYLFSWYGRNKYSYLPSQEKANFFYLIIEPDFEHPERLEDWLKLRAGDGKFIKTEVIAGGITLEKRTH